MKVKLKLPQVQPTDSLNAPFGTLLIALQERLKDTVPEIRFVDEDKGQLEMERPPVSYPCLLVSFADFEFEDMAEGLQQADGVLQLRLCVAPYSHSSNITPKSVRAKALSIYDLEWQIYRALHKWSPPKYDALLRRKSAPEERDDGLIVRRLFYATGFEDYATVKRMTETTLPPLSVD